MRISVILLLTLLSTATMAQTSYTDRLAKHREKYTNELLTSAGGPIDSVADLAYVNFYSPDSTYRITATVVRTPDAQPFEMPTYNGKTRPHVAYALLSFMLDGKPQTLTLYRNLNVSRLPEYRDYLFLPFKDATSGKETYGGGRYLDLRLGDIQSGQVVLDFNKAYNPYCAFKEGYACPIPPKNNELATSVAVGEKAYGKAH